MLITDNCIRCKVPINRNLANHRKEAFFTGGRKEARLQCSPERSRGARRVLIVNESYAKKVAIKGSEVFVKPNPIRLITYLLDYTQPIENCFKYVIDKKSGLLIKTFQHQQYLTTGL